MYEFGVDFVARCLAGEALAKASEAALNLVAGDNIDITYDSSTGETVISNSMEVDDELSLSSENPVQNKVITDALRYKPDTYTGETKVANQKIVQLTRAQYDAIQNKDPNTYYMITDDTDSYVIRTAYKDMTNNYTSRVVNGELYVTFPVPDDFTMLEARICYDIVWSCGKWSRTTNSLTSVLTITPQVYNPPRDGRKTYMGVLTDQYLGTAPNQTHVVVSTAELIGANYITYNEIDHTVTIKVTKPTYAYDYLTGDEVDNTTLTVHSYNVTELGYVAFGSDNINFTHDSYRAGTGISISNNGVISLAADYGASLEMTIDPDTYVITTVLKDQNGNTLGQAQSIDLPLESVVVSGRYDAATKTIILTLEGGSTISIPVGDLVSGLESTTNKVTSIDSTSTNAEYPSAKAVYDLVDDIETLPASTSSDEGKVLTVDVNGDAEWATPSTGVVDYDLLSHRPAINGTTLTGDKTGAQLGLVDSGELNNYLTTASAANTYQTKAGMANYLSTTDAATLYQPKGEDIVPDVTSADNGKVLKATYSGGVGTYAWETEAAEKSITSIVWLSGRILTPGGWVTTSEPGQMSAEDTYQINYSDNTTSTFIVTNGNGVAGVYKTGDTAEYTNYTMQFTNMTTFDFKVMKPTNEVPNPVAADAGKVLTATSAGAYQWSAIPTPSVDEVPDVTSTDDGKVLTASYSGGTGSYSWQPASGGGGGLQVETDGTNYWITVNGIRLYFADSAPTGTIPDGSMGIGW